MKDGIRVAKHIGLCANVERAIKIAREARERFARTVYTLGWLTNNRNVTDLLISEGIVPTESVKNLKEGDVLVVSAHGAAPQVYAYAEARGITVVDATCPNIVAIHAKVKEYSELGYRIIIAGDGAHREVYGTAGYAADVRVIAEAEEAEEAVRGADKCLLVAQTTFDGDKFGEITRKIEKLVSKSAQMLVILNSICYTTIARQAEAKEIAAASDHVFVVGDRHSSNVAKLYGIAKRYAKKGAYLIESAADLDSVTDQRITKPGIIAGASTPKELIMEVIYTMDQNNNTVDNVETVVTTEPVAEAAVETTAEEKAAVAAPKAKKASSEITSMEDALNSGYAPRTYHENMRVKATIESIDATGVSVSLSLSGKNDAGFIAADEMELDGSYDMSKYAVGDTLEAIIIPKGDNKSKTINLSKKKYDEILVADEAVKSILAGEEFSLTVSSVTKGGLLGKLGSYTIFVPASQIRIGYVKNLDEYVGKKLRLRILPPKETAVAEGEEAAPARRPNPKRIVASQRIILEEERAAREDAFWEAMQVNNIIKGKVKRFAMKDGKYFGVFVSIMNKDCLLHISDLSWSKVDDPATVLEINKSYEFVVLKADRENDKVSLGYKQLQKQPYELAAEKYHVGDVVKGKVERIKDFGAFISIEPGIDGLVHVSEICHKWISHASEVLKVGDEVEAKIISFEKNKITLSIKALQDAPVAEAASDEEGEEKPSRTARFNKRAAGADDSFKEKKERRSRQANADDDEPHEYVTSTSVGATMADLFKSIDLKKFDESADEGSDK